MLQNKSLQTLEFKYGNVHGTTKNNVRDQVEKMQKSEDDQLMVVTLSIKSFLAEKQFPFTREKCFIYQRNI